MEELRSTPEACRRFLRKSLYFDHPFTTTEEAIRYHGYIQIDPIDVCGKMHDLILRNRVRNYRRDDLLKAVYQKPKREFFEHYVGVLVALPVEDYRYLLPRMKSRRTDDGYSGALDTDQKKMARRILTRIKAEGPLCSSDFEDTGRSQTGWGTNGTLAKTTLDKLFFHGRLLIARRDNFRRVFDLPERVLPETVLVTRPATQKEIDRWVLMTKLRQRRLVALTSPQVKLVREWVTKVTFTDHTPLYCLREDIGALQRANEASAKENKGVHFLAPLDPIIYDRKVTKRLWDFDYTWEVYTPPAKRVRGYYALPILHGTQIVGHIDPKVDRTTNTLHAKVVVDKGTDMTATLKEFREFLGVEAVKVK